MVNQCLEFEGKDVVNQCLESEGKDVVNQCLESEGKDVVNQCLESERKDTSAWSLPVPLLTMIMFSEKPRETQLSRSTL